MRMEVPADEKEAAEEGGRSDGDDDDDQGEGLLEDLEEDKEAIEKDRHGAKDGVAGRRRRRRKSSRRRKAVVTPRRRWAAYDPR